MPDTGRVPLGLRALKLILGTDQPSVAVAAAAICAALGNIYVFHIVDFAGGLKPPLWQMIGAGLALALFLMPFFFLAVSRTLLFMSPWEGLAILTAASLIPPILARTGALGVTNPVLLIGGCIVFLVATFLVTRLIIRWKR